MSMLKSYLEDNWEDLVSCQLIVGSARESLRKISFHWSSVQETVKRISKRM
jgi:hypothetical protein